MSDSFRYNKNIQPNLKLYYPGMIREINQQNFFLFSHTSSSINMQAVILCCAFLFSLSLINAFVLRLPSKSSKLVCGFKISDREKFTSTTTKSIAKRTNRNKTILRDILGLGSCNSMVFIEVCW